MKVRSMTLVNVRHGGPHRSAPLKGVLNPGFDVTVREVQGESIHGNAAWYVDQNGDFLWSGGFEPVTGTAAPPALVPSPTARFEDYNRHFVGSIAGLPDNKGEGVRVAVLDTGVDPTHPDFGSALPPEHRIGFVGDPNDATDRGGHGTHCAGLIGARASGTTGVVGVAPECELFILKVSTDDGVVRAGPVERALHWIENERIDVVNMSLNLPTEGSEVVKSRLRRVSDLGVLLVAAAGNNITLAPGPILFPASHDHVIAVGAVTSGFVQNNATPSFSPQLSVMLPMRDVYSTSIPSLGPYKELRGTSMATACVSGICALIISHLMNSGGWDPQTVREELVSLGVEYRPGLDVSALSLIRPTATPVII